MNNLTFGNATYQYYETICSGAPAGPGFNGASGVHTHMTNSRLTDPEVLESRFPVVLEDFHIRRGSGGKGRWNAGDGTLRRLRFRERMDLALLTSHRRVPNFGIEGGEAGELGHNYRAPHRRAQRGTAGLRADHAGTRRGGGDRHADRRRLGQSPMKNLITDVPGVLVGHADDARLASGVTVVLFEAPAAGGMATPGGAPACARAR